MNQSNQQVIEISRIFFNNIKQMDEEEGLSPEELPDFKKDYVKRLYPHKEDRQHGIRKYQCCQACCSAPGYFCCCTSPNPGGEFVKFGLSICLYFKFLKHVNIFYVFLAALAVLSCVVCYEVSLQNRNNPLDNYSNFLFSTTYGAFSSEHNKCQYSLITSKNGIRSASFNLKCPTGTLNVFKSVLSSQSLNSLYNCRNQRKKQESGDNSSQYLPVSSQKTCNSDGSECNITQAYSASIASTNYTTVAYTYQCLNNYYQIGAIKQKSAYYLYFVIAIDLFFCLWFMFFLRSEIGAEKDETAFFKKTQVSLDDFSIKINGFTTKTADQEFQALVKAIKAKYPTQDITRGIVSYTFPENQKLLSFYKEKFQVFKQVIDLIKEYYFNDPDNKRLPFLECHLKVFQSQGTEGKFQEFRQKLCNLIRTILEYEGKKFQIEEQSDDKISLLLVFDGVNKKRMVKSLIVESCCSNNQIHVDNKIYEISSAPVPDMIQWDNKYSWRKLRIAISWIFTIAICVGSYLLFGYIQYKQSLLFTEYNYGIDCNILYTSAQLNVVDTTLLSQPNYVTCICKSQSLLDSSSQNNAYCSTWQQKYRLYLIVPLLISLGIVFYNVIVSYIFRWMGYFQKHKFLIDQELSFTLKRAFLLVMNMGLIMILLNYNYRKSINLNQVSFIFLGKYDDFTADWYQSIGAIIIMTLIFNIATPIAEFILSFILKCFRKCWDTRCFRKATSSKTKSEYLDLYSEDIFPIGERYAYLIATFFITFSFSGVIPILIPITLISFFLLYFSDKLLIFKFYQTPKNYTPTLHKLFINVLIISLISHFALTCYFLSQPTLIATDSNIKSPPATVTSNTRVNAIITTIYMYPYLGLLALVLAYFSLDIFCGSLMTTLTNCFCKKDEEVLMSNQSAFIQEITFWNTLSKLQLENLLKVSQYNLERYKKKQDGGINRLLSQIEQDQLAATHHLVTNASQILQSTVLRLKQKQAQYEADNNMFSSMRTILLGLPSYDYFIQKDGLSQNSLMLKMEIQLRDYYKQRIRTAQESRRQASPPKFHSIKDDSAANLHNAYI